MIFAWLATLQNHLATKSRDTRKRKAPTDADAHAVASLDTCRHYYQQGHLSSPPLSHHEMDQERTPNRKRPRGDDNQPVPDPDLTPRPSDSSSTAGSIRRSIPDMSATSIASHSPSSKSNLSSRSTSPRKQMMRLSVAEDSGLSFRQLNLNNCPVSATPLLRTMTDISNGHDILPHHHRDEIHASSSCCRDGDTRLWRYSFKPPEDDERNQMLPGRIPTVKEVEMICELAAECQVLGVDETGWNMEVHHRLLEAVFRMRPNRGEDEFNFISCASARPHRSFLPDEAPMKLVDFCVYADKEGDDNWARAHRALARHTSTRSVNHTDYSALQLRPIMLSVETKVPGKESEKADLQVGVWLAAHWAFLTVAARLSLDASLLCAETHPQQSSGASPSPMLTSMGRNRLAQARVDTLQFLPSLVVQGHKWSLVIATREQRGTVLWSNLEFGSTETMQGTYKVVAGLRELAAWSREVYLPWWQENVLDGF